MTDYLRLERISKSFKAGGVETRALDDITLGVAEGEFLAIVGPSGCGKSTLLQIAAALIAPSAGEVRLNGAPVTAPPESMVYLFQQYAKSLFPWRTVLDNVAFAVERRKGMSGAAVRAHSRRFLKMVGLADFADRYPWQLSGGMQQRVAIARALAAEPRVLLMDEPFSSVDALTRLELHGLVLDLWEKQRFTAVLVTHDVDEAVFLADRVAVLSARPSTVVRAIPTDLPRPRDNLATREDPRFLALRHDLLSMLLNRPHG
ncbi:MAG TPA: ABC transporter ATP-binding protein [Burkholderiales bacterium]|nr:ABC transporter ATP-binding protein [Burkholderiales bacterium]